MRDMKEGGTRSNAEEHISIMMLIDVDWLY